MNLHEGPLRPIRWQTAGGEHADRAGIGHQQRTAIVLATGRGGGTAPTGAAGAQRKQAHAKGKMSKAANRLADGVRVDNFQKTSMGQLQSRECRKATDFLSFMAQYIRCLPYINRLHADFL